MEGTKALVVVPGLFQVDIVADDIDDVQTLFDFVYNAHTVTYIARLRGLLGNEGSYNSIIHALVVAVRQGQKAVRL